MSELMDELKGLLLENKMTPILESLLKNVEEGDWGVRDELICAGEKTFSSSDLYKYIVIKNDRIRIKLYEDTNLSEGIDLKFSELPNLIDNRYSGGSFMIQAYANKNGNECVAYIDHQCRTGGRVGFEGAVFLVGNVLNMVKNEKGYRAYFQVMGNTLNALKKAEKKIGITESPLRNIYYNMYKQDTIECIDYLLNPELDDFQKWSGWYGLGATLVNLLNMDLKDEEKNELNEFLVNQKLLPYYNEILKSGEFSYNRNVENSMEKILRNIISEMNHKNKEILNNPNLKYYSEIVGKLKKIYPIFAFDANNILTVPSHIFNKITRLGKFEGFVGDASTYYLISDGNLVFPAIIDSHSVVRSNKNMVYDISQYDKIIESLNLGNNEFNNLSKNYSAEIINKAIMDYYPIDDKGLGFSDYIKELNELKIKEENEKKETLSKISDAQSIFMYKYYKEAKSRGEIGHFLPSPPENESDKKLITIQELKEMVKNKVKIFEEEIVIEEEEEIEKLLEQERIFNKIIQEQRQFLPLIQEYKRKALSNIAIA